MSSDPHTLEPPTTIRLSPLELSRTDDPEVLAEAARDDYSLHVVPRSWRSSSPKVALAWSAVMSAMFWWSSARAPRLSSACAACATSTTFLDDAVAAETRS